MSNLFDEVNTLGTTENGMATNTTTTNACLDLFFQVGASRGRDISDKVKLAFKENEELALSIMLFARDIRGGLGERSTFRNNINSFTNIENASSMMDKIVELGRYDDLHVYIGTKHQNLMVKKISTALDQGNQLCAKWTPRKGKVFNLLCSYRKVPPKTLRKTLVALTDVVETKMCDGKWKNIEYDKLPSKAQSIYSTAFERHDPYGYREYSEALTDGKTKINANAVYPHDIYKALRNGGNTNVLSEQWNALPDYLENDKFSIIPVVDTSGSMECGINNDYSSKLSCLDVAVSLGMYVAERAKGIFKNEFITFSNTPKMQKIKGDNLLDKFNNLSRADWGMSTNLMATFDLILQTAKRAELKADDLPTHVLIMSDMEFDRCSMRNSNTAMEGIEERYKAAGYETPKLVFWNLNARNDNFPVRQGKEGTALVSGFSPALMKSILSGKSFNPVDIMLEAVNIDRYKL